VASSGPFTPAEGTHTVGVLARCVLYTRS
jgi:hypothetical protein